MHVRSEEGNGIQRVATLGGLNFCFRIRRSRLSSPPMFGPPVSDAAQEIVSTIVFSWRILGLVTILLASPRRP